MLQASCLIKLFMTSLNILFDNNKKLINTLVYLKIFSTASGNRQLWIEKLFLCPHNLVQKASFHLDLVDFYVSQSQMRSNKSSVICTISTYCWDNFISFIKISKFNKRKLLKKLYILKINEHYSSKIICSKTRRYNDSLPCK